MQQVIIEKISFLIAFGMSCLAAVKAVQAWSEGTSIGKKAMADVLAKVEAIRADTESVKRKVEAADHKSEDLERSVKRLDEHVSELIQSMFKFMQGKSR
ncbi:MAG TPA: hypothetical protein VD794_10230 [Flavisolibacter sp.]|nr:hypothetical protein [Flavisolibacter sp.]